MANKIVNVDNLQSKILEALKEYSLEVDEAVQEECLNIAKEIKRNLENDPNIPVGNSKKHYKKQFYTKTDVQKRGFIRLHIANKKYQLTHLLEEPHEIVGRNGKRTGRKSKAFPHWEKAQKNVDTLTDNIIKRISL